MSRRHEHAPSHPAGRAVFFEDMLAYGHRIDRWLADGSIIGLFENNQAGSQEVARLHPVDRVFSKRVLAVNRKHGLTAGFPVRMKMFPHSTVTFQIEYLVKPSSDTRKYYNKMTMNQRLADKLFASRYRLLKRQSALRLFIHTAIDTEFVQREMMPGAMFRFALPKH